MRPTVLGTVGLLLEWVGEGGDIGREGEVVEVEEEEERGLVERVTDWEMEFCFWVVRRRVYSNHATARSAIKGGSQLPNIIQPLLKSSPNPE